MGVEGDAGRGPAREPPQTKYRTAIGNGRACCVARIALTRARKNFFGFLRIVCNRKPRQVVITLASLAGKPEGARNGESEAVSSHAYGGEGAISGAPSTAEWAAACAGADAAKEAGAARADARGKLLLRETDAVAQSDC